MRRTTTPELFFFDYGVVVMWGLTEEEERAILEDIRPFEEDSIGKFLNVYFSVIICLFKFGLDIDYDEIEPEKFHYLYSRQQQARIYNDIITLISPTSSMMIKLTISHACAQVSLF